jgi:hypothetical protein
VGAIAIETVIVASRLIYDGLACVNVMSGAVTTISLAAHAFDFLEKISLLNRISSASLAIFSAIVTGINFTVFARPIEERNIDDLRMVLYSPFLLLSTFLALLELEPLTP